MSIAIRQFSTFLEKVMRGFLVEGKVPPGNVLGLRLLEFANSYKGGPTFAPALVDEYGTFDVVAWNRQMDQCGFDIQVLYEELLMHALGIMKRTSWAETAYRAQRGQIARLNSVLDDVLFMTQNSDHFLGISDTLTDMSNMDVQVSTKGVLDLREHALLIPASQLATKRIKLDHLATNLSKIITIVEPSSKEVIEAKTAVDAPFGNIFQDIISAWRHDVIIKEGSGPVEISFDFSVDPNNKKLNITTIKLLPQVENFMTVTILYNSDGINWIQLPNGSDGIVMRGMNKEYSFDFEHTEIKNIRIMLRKDTPDEVMVRGSRFSFGLRSISLLAVVRGNEATYQTIELNPSDSTIEQVALEVIEEVPSNTNIDYFVAGSGEFLPILPLGRVSGSAPDTVKFGTSQTSRINFVSSPVSDGTYKSVEHFKIYDGEVSSDVVYGSAKLWRGQDSWARKTSVEEVVNTINDVYVTFDVYDEQSLYAYKVETASSYSAVNNLAQSYTAITLTNSIYFDYNAGHQLVPSTTVDFSTDKLPNYAIAQILGNRLFYGVTGESVVLNAYNLTELAYRNVDERESITITDETDTTTYVEGLDYILEKFAGDHKNKYTGRIARLRGATSIGDGDTIHVSYTIRRDITHLANTIFGNNKKIGLKNVVSADTFDVRYRFVPSGIVRSSIVVTENFGADQGAIYREGADYTIDPRVGKITKMPPDGGKIGISCYVDFQYVEEQYSIEAYSAWAHVDRTDPFKIEFATLGMDKTAGEKFFLDVNNGIADLTEATSTPALTKGWHRFSVLSTPVTDESSGIRKVLGLVDLDGVPIFSGTKYFSELRAFRTPMTQVTKKGLRFAVRKNDHSKFYIGDTGELIVNYEPGETEDITTYLADTTGELSLQDERYELEYRVRSAVTPDTIKLRIVLNRVPGTDTGITPKVKYWALRIKDSS